MSQIVNSECNPLSPPHPGLIGFAALIRNPRKRQQQLWHKINTNTMGRKFRRNLDPSWRPWNAKTGCPLWICGQFPRKARGWCAGDCGLQMTSIETYHPLAQNQACTCTSLHLNTWTVKRVTNNLRVRQVGIDRGWLHHLVWLNGCQRTRPLSEFVPQSCKIGWREANIWLKQCLGQWRLTNSVLVLVDDPADEKKTTTTFSSTTPTTSTFYPPAAPIPLQWGLEVFYWVGAGCPKNADLYAKLSAWREGGHNQWTKCHWIHNLQGCFDSHNATNGIVQPTILN